MSHHRALQQVRPVRAFLLFGNSHIWALRQKRFFFSYMGAIYGCVFPIFAFFYSWSNFYVIWTINLQKLVLLYEVRPSENKSKSNPSPSTFLKEVWLKNYRIERKTCLDFAKPVVWTLQMQVNAETFLVTGVRHEFIEGNAGDSILLFHNLVVNWWNYFLNFLFRQVKWLLFSYDC